MGVASFVTPYDSGANSELNLTVPITVSNPPVTLIYAVAIQSIKVSDVLLCYVEAEYTNPFAYNVGVFSQIILGTQPGVSGTSITHDNGRNIDPNMHHDTHTKIGHYLVTSNQSPAYILYTVDASSSSAAGGDQLIVEPNYGRLRVLHFHA